MVCWYWGIKVYWANKEVILKSSFILQNNSMQGPSRSPPHPSPPPPLPPQHSPKEFRWGERWLRGEEYAHMLANMSLYCQHFGFEICSASQHPIWVYQSPRNGAIYFMKGESLQNFRFPRIHTRKNYRWKKMNFTTDLPKRHPLVQYLVASAYQRHPLTSQANPYRMHVVRSLSQPTSYLLCHVREITPQEQRVREQELGLGLQGCMREGRVDFMRLFCYLHHHCQQQ